MNRKTLKLFGGRPALAALSLAGFLLTTVGGNLSAQSKNSASQAGLVGTWFGQVTLRDCTTNAALGPAFNTLVTYHRGGTLSETASSTGFAIGQRSPGHGIWTEVGGHTYHLRVLSLINFDTP